jgi:hypothetical protein
VPRPTRDRQDGRSGSRATIEPHGAHHRRVTGQTGARETIERHCYGFWRGLMDAKGSRASWQVGFLADLRAGRVSTDLDRAA